MQDTYTLTLYVVTGDGKPDHSWPHREGAERTQAKRPGSRIEEHTSEQPVAAYIQVMNDAGVPEEDRAALCLDMNRMLNMTHDAGRPSDAMRSTVAAWKRGEIAGTTLERS